LELSPVTIVRCQDEALGQVLTAWGREDETDLDYPEVLELLRDKDITSDDLYDHGILVWATFDDQTPEWIADQIESLYDSYIAIAKGAIGANCVAKGH